MVIAGRRQHFNDVVADLNDRDIEGTSAQVIDHNFLGFSMVKTI